MTHTDLVEPGENRVLGIPKASPDGLPAAMLLAFLTTAGLFYVNIMAALVAGLVDGLGLAQQTAGQVASANTYGAAFGALIIVFLVTRLNWRLTSYAAIAAMVAVDLASIFVTSGEMLIAIRFLHGIIGGFLVGVGFSVIARTANPDRAFGMLLVVQFGLGGLGVMTLPNLVPIYGHQVLFLALIAFSAVTVCMIPFLAAYPLPPKTPVDELDSTGRTQWLPLFMALFGIFFFQAANMGLAAYMIGLGRYYGGTTEFVSTTIGIATWIGALGSVLVVVIATKYGRFNPLLGAMTITAVGLALFHWSDMPVVFMLANAGTAITWSFVIPYLLGLAAAFDETGRTSALGGFFSKMGLASGPFIASLVLGENNYGLMINLSVVALFLSMTAVLWPAKLLDRRFSPVAR